MGCRKSNLFMNNFMLHKLSSAKNFYQFANYCMPWCFALSAILFIYGLIGGLILAPADYQQGDAFRIIYIHVPSAFLSLLVYMVMAAAAAVLLIWRIKLADVIIAASAPLGASFTALALISGSIWGKPMWGAWWVWDARLTSELILLFLYLGVIALRQAIPDRDSAARASSILLVVGIINIPIIHYSVYWWNTLHQGQTIKLFGPSLIAPSMLHPLLAMIAAFFFYYCAVMLLRAKSEILRREWKSSWVRELLV
jgi:heme exporter protein C